MDTPETRYARSGDVPITCQVAGDDIGASAASQARPGEVLVAGSGIQFRERGVAEFKGVPGEWRLFAVDSA